jgi:Rrf2 family nitric oxide-sensitive transcriptional repressor
MISMRLALQTDYSLRTLMYLATRPGRQTVAGVAEFFQISQAHIGKVVHQLARLGYVRSIRGIGGGLELARSPDEISVGEVIRAVEGNVHLLECIGMDDVCVIQKHCKLRTVLDRAERIQFEYLDAVRLSDVLPYGLPERAPNQAAMRARATTPVEPTGPSTKRTKPRGGSASS